ncbi:MAG: hypothetical protein Q7S82_01885 [bacterium]|nr:hypothetical protein [bacterium]
MLSKLIQFVKEHQGDIILVIGAALISLLSFAMGYITAKQEEKEPIQFETPSEQNLMINK